jgi:hypothetical protein
VDLEDGKIAKTAICLLIILLIISLCFNYRHFKDKKTQKDQYSIFLNHFYFSIDDSTKIVSEILNEELTGDQLNKELMRLAFSLNKADNLLTESALYLEGVNHQGITFFQLASQTIVYGTEYEGKQIHPFGKNFKITQGERAYLNELQKYLKNMHKRLYSGETRRDNPGISKYVFNHDLIPSAREHYFLLDKYAMSDK